MLITLQTIQALLREADIEGYIELGAPADEYDSEAEIITTSMNQLSGVETTQENIAAIIFHVWRQSFNLDDSDLTARQPAINSVAKIIMRYCAGTGA